MNHLIKPMTKVTCPVTDTDGEVEFKIGVLVKINKRFAYVDLGDGNDPVKVGCSKIEVLEEKSNDKPKAEGKVPQGDYDYVKVVAASGNRSLDNGDQVAEMLRGQTLESVYKIVALEIQIPIRTLKARYAHLNTGMQRMNLGNRLRKVIRSRQD